MTSTAPPGKYRVSARVNDPEIRRLLDRAIDGDGRISFYEVYEILAAIAADDRLTMVEVQDLKTIFEYSQTLDGPSKELLRWFIANAAKMQAASEPVPRPAGTSQSATQQADQEFRRRHPELKGRALTSAKSDAALRAEWVQLYKQFGGR